MDYPLQWVLWCTASKMSDSKREHDHVHELQWLGSRVKSHCPASVTVSSNYMLPLQPESSYTKCCSLRHDENVQLALRGTTHRQLLTNGPCADGVHRVVISTEPGLAHAAVLECLPSAVQQDDHRIP